MAQSPFLNETLHLSALVQRPLSLPELRSESTLLLVQSHSSFPGQGDPAPFMKHPLLVSQPGPSKPLICPGGWTAQTTPALSGPYGLW